MSESLHITRDQFFFLETLFNTSSVTPMSTLLALTKELPVHAPELSAAPDEGHLDVLMVVGPHEFRRRVMRGVKLNYVGDHQMLNSADPALPRSDGLNAWGAAGMARMLQREYEDHLTELGMSPPEPAKPAGEKPDWVSLARLEFDQLMVLSPEGAKALVEAGDAAGLRGAGTPTNGEEAVARLRFLWARYVLTRAQPIAGDPRVQEEVQAIGRELARTAEITFTYVRLVSWLQDAERAPLVIREPQTLGFLVRQLLALAAGSLSAKSTGTMPPFQEVLASCFSMDELDQEIREGILGSIPRLEMVLPAASPPRAEKEATPARKRTRTKSTKKLKSGVYQFESLTERDKTGAPVVEKLKEVLLPSARPDSDYLRFYAWVEMLGDTGTDRGKTNVDLWLSHLNRIRDQLVCIQYMGNDHVLHFHQARIAYLDEKKATLYLQDGKSVQLGMMRAFIVLDAKASTKRRTKRIDWVMHQIKRFERADMEHRLNDPDVVRKSFMAGEVAWASLIPAMTWSLDHRRRVAVFWRKVLLRAKGKKVRLERINYKSPQYMTKAAVGYLRFPKTKGLEDECLLALSPDPDSDDHNEHLELVNRAWLLDK